MAEAGIRWIERPAPWVGEFQGDAFGSGVSIIFTRLDGSKNGPALHRHPYSETFLVRRGRAAFQVGGARIEARAGQIVVVPPGVSHRFTGLDDGVEMIDVHASPLFVTEWLTAAT